MSVDDVDVVHLQSFERLLDALANMFAISGFGGVEVRIRSSVNFGGDHDLLSRNLELFKDSAEDDFGFSECVDLGSVEMVDAVFETGGDDLFVFFVIFGFIVDHVAQGDD